MQIKSKLGMRASCLFSTILFGAANLLTIPLAQATFETPGQLSVSPAGAVSYNVPIVAPPGTAGMAPNLALVYNSQGGNGFIGMGWSISGLSAIYRCGRTLIQDGAKDTVGYNTNDKYCLDGQRLVPVTATASPPAWCTNSIEYRTERESFTRIVSCGTAGSGPYYFVAKTKAGQTIEFGNTADSRIEAQGKTDVRVWASNRISDTMGNYLTVSYIEDNANGDYRPDRIDYTGNVAAGLASYNSVRFIYATGDRPDITPLYQAGSVTKSMKLLVKVQTYAKVNGTDTLVKEYRLVYGTSSATSRSRLASITECAGDGTCLQASIPTWQDNSTTDFNYGGATQTSGLTGWAILSNYWGWASAIGSRLFTMDVNGDGKSDLVGRDGAGALHIYLSNGTGFTYGGATQTSGLTGWAVLSDNVGWASGIGSRLFTMDVNGDGKSDLVGRDGAGALHIYLSNGTGFTYGGATQTSGLTGWAVLSDGGWATGIGSRLFTMDVNGDGKSDLVGRDGAGALQIYLSNGTGFTYGGATQTSGLTGWAVLSDSVGWASGIGSRLFTVDVNGDGKSDLVGRDGAGALHIYLSNGTGFTYGGATQTSGLTGWAVLSDGGWATGIGSRLFTMDVNGDGKSDLVGRDGAGALQLYLSNGTGFTYGGATQTSGLTGWAVLSDSVGWASGIGSRLFTMDVNGDGKPDLVGRDGAGALHIYLSNGTGFTYGGATQTSGLTGWAVLSDGSWATGNLFTMDVNGDGKTDLVGRDPEGALQMYLSDGVFPDLLATITTGLGNVTSMVYKPITNGDVYTRDSGAVYPYSDIQTPMYVVSSVSASDGIGGTRSATYKYYGAKAHLTGGGFLGFRQYDVTDAASGIKNSTVFRQDYPYQGLPASVTQTQSNGRTLHSVTNTWSFTTYADTVLPVTAQGSKHHYPWASSVLEKTFELDNGTTPFTQVKTDSQLDAYGNATSITVCTLNGAGVADGYSKTTTNVYTNDITNWLLGRLTSAAVSSTTP